MPAVWDRDETTTVAGGGGLVAIHGATTTRMNSEKFRDLLGGSFNGHAFPQEVHLVAADPEHPLAASFRDPMIHVDEAYFYQWPENGVNFRPLLKVEVAKLKKAAPKIKTEPGYAAWIKPHGKGRVFHVSPSHNAHSFDDPRLIKFYLDGIQYALGDLQCDDAPVVEKRPNPK